MTHAELAIRASLTPSLETEQHDPLHDAGFIRTLNAAYDIGGPARYPECAPVTPVYTHAA